MARKQARFWTTMLLALTMTAATACSNDGDGKASDAGPSVSTNPSAAASPTAVVPEGPTGKYDPPIEVTTVRSVNAGVRFQEGESYDTNIWTQEFEDNLGIKVKNVWKVSDQQYQNKMAVTMASGDLPDFMLVDAQQFQILNQAGQLADLTEVYRKYASDIVKKSFEDAGGIRLKAATINGKIMGIPFDGGSQNDAPMLFIRNDWLKNVGMEPPKTMDDVIKIAEAFTKNDPDKNGKDDTFGLSLDLNLWNGWSGLDGFFNGYHAYPYNPTKGSGINLMFLKGADGKAVWADTQPEVKTALGKLAELFKVGAINPEFSVIDGTKSAELATSQKVGMSFGQWWVVTWPIQNMKKDVNADWGVYPLVSADGQPVKAQSMGGLPSRFWVVSKKSAHPEAPYLMLNDYFQKIHVERDTTYQSLDANGVSYARHMYPPITGGPLEVNQESFYSVEKALQAGDGSKLNATDKKYFDQVMQFRNGDNSQWAAEKVWGPGGVYEALGKYKKGNHIQQTVYSGVPTATMIAKGPSLRDMEVKTFTEIIMGAKPVDAFDEFVQKWMESGGQEILDEINASGQVQ